MGFAHTVRRGDSLWNLAGRYPGNHNRWPAIHDYHKKHNYYLLAWLFF
jgi:nucleoid-associated protein YgaU